MELIDPNSALDWSKVATEREHDFRVLQAAQRSVAALYFLGFAAECHAKALIRMKDASADTYGHDVIRLLNRAGVSRDIVPELLRTAAETRNVALRYQAELPASAPTDVEMAMEKLVRYISKLVERENRRPRVPKMNANANGRRP